MPECPTIAGPLVIGPFDLAACLGNAKVEKQRPRLTLAVRAGMQVLVRGFDEGLFVASSLGDEDERKVMRAIEYIKRIEDFADGGGSLGVMGQSNRYTHQGIEGRGAGVVEA